MIDFVDLHCHTLFRVDDGAQDEGTMQKMLDIAYSNGTRYICFTPHFKIYEFEDEDEMYAQMERIERRFSVAREYACEKYSDLKLFLGNEIMYHSDISDSLFSKRCHFLGNSNFALIEFSPDSSDYEIENTVIKLLRKGICPVIAHVERYSAFVKDLSFAKSLKENGALLQANARAITKFKIGKTAKFLKNALKKHLIDVVASDAHNDTTFSPDLSKAYAMVAKNCGTDYADKIFHHTPLSILLCQFHSVNSNEQKK